MHINQCRDRHAGRAQRHSSAGGGIEHPTCHHDEHARRRLDVDNLTAAAALRILAPNAPSVERMPAVADFNFLPEMGRMTP
jgi:hypothetical protein